LNVPSEKINLDLLKWIVDCSPPTVQPEILTKTIVKEGQVYLVKTKYKKLQVDMGLIMSIANEAISIAKDVQTDKFAKKMKEVGVLKDPTRPPFYNVTKTDRYVYGPFTGPYSNQQISDDLEQFILPYGYSVDLLEGLGYDLTKYKSHKEKKIQETKDSLSQMLEKLISTSKQYTDDKFDIVLPNKDSPIEDYVTCFGNIMKIATRKTKLEQNKQEKEDFKKMVDQKEKNFKIQQLNSFNDDSTSLFNVFTSVDKKISTGNLKFLLGKK
jgi:hypothetical protein